MDITDNKPSVADTEDSMPTATATKPANRAAANGKGNLAAKPTSSSLKTRPTRSCQGHEADGLRLPFGPPPYVGSYSSLEAAYEQLLISLQKYTAH